jgi:hypothetical protein
VLLHAQEVKCTLAQYLAGSVLLNSLVVPIPLSKKVFRHSWQLADTCWA